MFKRIAMAAVAAATLAAQAIPAAACGGLVAPNGAIRLSRASTLVDWHDGVEHYMTSFSYQGENLSNFGWIVPLPAVPQKVEEGGGWTLQRLNRALDRPPFNFVLHTAPVSDDDLEYYHWHFEIMPNLTRIAGFEMGSGFHINPTPPEDAAQYLRELAAEAPAGPGR